jgi:hypothetical protein
VIQAAEEGWGAFEQMFDGNPVRVCLGVTEGDSESPAGVSHPCERTFDVDCCRPGELHAVRFRPGLCVWVGDAEHGGGSPVAALPVSTAGGATLAQQRAFAPLHGALVMRNGTGVMLCGDSCAGKSTLAYGCARAGWTYVSDDGTFLVRGRDDRYAIGDPHGIRFRTDAPACFPNWPIIRRRFGRTAKSRLKFAHAIWAYQPRPDALSITLSS